MMKFNIEELFKEVAMNLSGELAKTNFNDVNLILDKITFELQKYFKEKLIGIYLYGSLALGDFNYNTSDIDVFVVLELDINDKDFWQLSSMHDTLVKDFPDWDDRIEIAYVSLSSLTNFRVKKYKIAVISPGEPFNIKDAGTDWLINFYLLHNNSITLLGPEAKDIISPISDEEFVNNVKEQAIEWRFWVEQTKKSIGYQFYAVLTICRAYYVVFHGKQVSKLTAALWMKSNFDKWQKLIDNTLVYSQSQYKPPFESQYEAVYQFVHEVVNIMEKKVYKPLSPWSKNIHQFLVFMKSQGFNTLPEPLGVDDKGYEILSYIEGKAGDYPLTNTIRSNQALTSCAKLLRKYHDVSAKFVQSTSFSLDNWMFSAREPVEVICHNDFAPYNICYIEENVTGIIDFEACIPGPRLWDIAYALYRFAPFTNPDNEDGFGNLEEQITRAKQFCDVYEVNKEDRRKLVDIIVERLEALNGFLISAARKGNKKYQNHLNNGHQKKYLDDIEYIKINKAHIQCGLQGEEFIIRKLKSDDIPIIVDSFSKSNWTEKSAEIFERYLREQKVGDRIVWVTYYGREFSGYATLKWESQYGPFQEKKIPEINDLNVLPEFRNLGIGSALMSTCEEKVALKSNIVGIGVGLYSDYGAAQKLYAKRGYVVDGKGITYNYNFVTAGAKYPIDDDLVLWMTKTLSMEGVFKVSMGNAK